MRALQQDTLDGPGDLRLVAAAPVPSPGPGEVLIRVVAAGVNYGDIAQAHGAFLGGPRPPYLAGFEAAGEIVTAGPDVAGLEPGALVVGVGLGCGALAEYTALPVVSVLPVPAGWAAAGALGLLVNWTTALAALRPLGRLAAGETVVVPAAAGATGQAAVRLARHYGVTVVGLNIGVLAQAAPRIFVVVMGELFALIAAGVVTPGQPARYELADGPRALAELAGRSTVGKLALLP